MSYTLANNTPLASVASITGMTIPATSIGNLGILPFNYSQADPQIASVTGGGTWTKIGTTQPDNVNNQYAEWWWTIFTGSVTALAFSACEAVTIGYCEFFTATGFAASPLRTQDTTKTFAATSTTPDANTSNNISPTAGDLVISSFYDTGGNQASITHGTGWTAGSTELGISGTGASAVEWQQAAGGSEHATLTVGTAGDNYTMQIAAFAPAGPLAPQVLLPMSVSGQLRT